MRSFRPLAPALLLVGAAAVAACSGGGAASPSAAPASTVPSEAPSSAPSVAPSTDASGAPSAAPSAATRVDVVGTDYAFSEFDATFSGPVAFAFRNEGEELHEMVIVRKNDDVTETFQELLALPEEEAFAKIGFAGQTFAEPGQTGPDIVTATEPGDYLMVCFVPQGTAAWPTRFSSQAPSSCWWQPRTSSIS